jgi:hypothetical protein
MSGFTETNAMEVNMPTRKKSAQPRKGSAAKATAAIKGGAVPPYGIAIRQAIARGDSREMRSVAVSARQYLSRVQAALDGLEKALAKYGS